MAVLDVDIEEANNKLDLERWAKIVIEKWEYNVVRFKLLYSLDLLNSFSYFINSESGGNRAVVSFAFKYYLRMLEMGVGKYAPIGSANSRRRKYPVFTKTFNAELYRLSELMSKQVANQAATTIVKSFGD